MIISQIRKYEQTDWPQLWLILKKVFHSGETYAVPTNISEKEAEFRSTLGDKDKWFADFIVAEHDLKDGRKTAAAEGFRESYEAMKQMLNNNEDVDTWAMAQARARLDTLTEQKIENVNLTEKAGVE